MPNMQGYSRVCSLGSPDLSAAPYRIENLCKRYVVCVRQRSPDSPPVHLVLKPGDAPLPFAWDRQLATKSDTRGPNPTLGAVVQPLGAHARIGP